MKCKNFIENYYIDFTINIWLLALCKRMQKDTFHASGPCSWHFTGKRKAQDWAAAQKSLSYLICTQPSGLASEPGILHSFALWVVLVWDVGHRAQWKSPAYLSVDSPPLTQKELPITAFNLLFVFAEMLLCTMVHNWLEHCLTSF